MQSTGHTSTQAVSFVLTHGSAMTYVMNGHSLRAAPGGGVSGVRLGGALGPGVGGAGRSGDEGSEGEVDGEGRVVTPEVVAAAGTGDAGAVERPGCGEGKGRWPGLIVNQTASARSPTVPAPSAPAIA